MRISLIMERNDIICMFKRISAAVDGSTISIRALDYAAEIANQNEAELTIISVIEPIPAFYAGSSIALEKEMHEIAEENYKKLHREQRKRLEEKYPGLKVTCLIEEGKAAEVIKEASGDSDLLVLGHRGLGGLLSVLLGSVAKQVVESCTVPVLVVKEKESC